MKISRRIRRNTYLCLMIYIMAFIFYQSSLPAAMSDRESGIVVRILETVLDRDFTEGTRGIITFTVRKLAHFTEFLLLGAFTSQYLRYRGAAGGLSGRAALSAGLFGVLYAVTDELHQGFVPGRSPEVLDICIDAAGVLTGILLVRFMSGHFNFKNRLEKEDDDG